MTRQELFDKIGEKLDYLGYQDVVNIKKGRLSIDIQFENGEHSLTIVERELTDENRRTYRRRT
jgi:hypothetical protein